MPDFRIQVPDGRIFTIRGAPTEQDAQDFVTREMQGTETSVAPAEDTRRLPTTWEAGKQGWWQSFGEPVRALGIGMQGTGIPGGETVQRWGDAINGEAPEGTRDVQLSDLRDQPLAAVQALVGQVGGNLLGLMATGVGSGLLARTAARTIGGMAAEGAAAVGRGTALGTTAASGVGASVSDLERSLVNENVDPVQARRLALTVGPLIGAGEVAGPIAILNRALGREISRETAQAIARAGALRTMGREGLRDARDEMLSETFGELGRQGVVAAQTGNLNLEQRGEQVLLNALGGALGGGAVGAGRGRLELSRARRQVEEENARQQGQQQETTPPAPEETPWSEAPNWQQPPEPITDMEGAAAFYQNEGQAFRPEHEYTTNEALINAANVAQTTLYEQTLQIQRREMLSRFLGNPQQREVVSEPAIRDEEGNITNPEATVTNSRMQRDVFYKNLTDMAVTQGLDLTKFTPQQIVNNLLERSNSPPLSPEQRTELMGMTRDALNQLVREKQLAREGKNFRVSYIDEAELRRQQWERDKANFGKPPKPWEKQPAEPTQQQLDEEQRRLRATHPALYEQANQEQRTAELNEMLGSPEAESFLRELIRQETKPGLSYRTWQEAFKRNTGFDLTPEQGGLLHKAAIRLGLLNNLGQMTPQVIKNNRDWQRRNNREAWKNAKKPPTDEDGEGTPPTPPENPPPPTPPTTFDKEGQGNLPGFENAQEQTKPPTVEPPEQTPTEQGNLDFEKKAEETPPASPPTAKSAPEVNEENKQGWTPPQNASPMAEQVARNYGGNVIYENKKTALIEARTKGLHHVYLGVNKEAGIYSTKDIAGITAADLKLTPEEMVNLREQKRQFLNAEREVVKANPDGPFKPGERFAKTENFPEHMYQYAQRLIDVLGMKDLKVFFMSSKDTDSVLNWGHKYNLTGDYSYLRSEVQRFASTTNLGYHHSNPVFNGKVTAIFVKDGLSPAIQMETIAHEIGHAFEEYALKHADEATRTQIMGEFVRWLNANKKKSGAEFIQLLRLPEVAKRILDKDPSLGTIKGSDLSYYHQSFTEWFADQVARWAVTNKEPQSLIGKFFKGIITGYRKILKSLGSDVLPHQSVVDFINSYRNGQYQSPNAMQDGRVANLDAAMAPTLNAMASEAGQTVRKVADNQISWGMRWFASPITMMPTMRPLLRPAAEMQKLLLGRRNQFLMETEDSPNLFARLPREAKIRVTHAWEQASRTQKAPAYNAMNETEANALKSLIAGGQRALDYFIESAVWKHFDPEAATSPAAQKKLEAFWAKNEGKHLWEISDSELRAASEEGFQKKQRMERLRNPYYMPMIAQGSHFVAVYKKNAKGEREGKPVEMRAFTPLNLFQKLTKQTDPEQLAISELQAKYGNTRQYDIMDRGIQFTASEEANNIRSAGDFVSEYLQKLYDLGGKNSAQFNRAISTMIDQLDKKQMERVFRPNQDILRPIGKYNEESYVLDVMPRYFAGMASISARRYTQEGWARALSNLSTADKQYLNDLRDYSTTPVEAFGGLRTFTFMWLMGFAPDTALVNAMQPLQTTLPMLIRDGGLGAGAYLKQGYGAVLRHFKVLTLQGLGRRPAGDFLKEIQKEGRTPQEKADIARAFEIGVFQPIYTNESRGQVTAAGMRGIFGAKSVAAAQKTNAVLKAAGMGMQSAEQINRIATFIAAYRLAQAKPEVIARSFKADKNFNGQPLTPYDYAVKVTYATQYITSKEDRAYFQRFSPGAEVLTQFMSFPMKSVEIFAQQFLTLIQGAKDVDIHAIRTGSLGVLTLMGSTMALAGVWGLPFAESLKELFEKIASAAWGSQQNFDAWMRNQMGGGRFAEFASHGLPHAAGVLSLSRRLAIDPVPAQDLMSSTALTLFGASAAMPEGAIRAYKRAQAGDYMNALALVMPRALGNVIKAADLQWGTQEYRSDRGRTIVSQEQIANLPDLASHVRSPNVPVMQTLGFQTPQITNMREAMLRADEVQKQNQQATEDANRELARNLTDLMRAQTQGDTDGAHRAANAYRERWLEVLHRNERAIAAGRLDLVLQPSMSAIQRRAYEDFRGLSSPEIRARRASPLRREAATQESALYDQPSE